MKLIEKNKEKISFTAEINESLANAIRRSINEIPILAIDEIEFHKNDSALYDEILAHRIGLVPLKMDKLLGEYEKCKCKGKGCNKCQIQLKLKAKGPATVYSEDLKGKVEVVYKKMPLVILSKDQEVELIAFARIGRGINHAKFSPGLIFYRNIPEINFNDECSGELCKRCVEICPSKIIKFSGKKPGITEIYECDMCMACVEECKKQGKNAIQIKPSKEILVTIESFGQLECKRIFTEAINSLNKNLKEVLKGIKR